MVENVESKEEDVSAEGHLSALSTKTTRKGGE